MCKTNVIFTIYNRYNSVFKILIDIKIISRHSDDPGCFVPTRFLTASVSVITF